MNDDTSNTEPVEMTELSPTRAELIARVRSRGRQIRARRRLAVTGVAALAVVAIAAPAIAIGARSSSHPVPPATVVAVKADFRIALVEHSSSDTSQTASSCVKYYFEKNCLALGRTLVTARDVRSTAVVYDKLEGWSVNVELDRAAAERLKTAPTRQVAIIVGGKVVDAPLVTSAITGGVVTLSGPSVATREQAIALATTAAGRAPTHVDPAPDLTASIELPAITIGSAATMQATLVVVNHTAHAITLVAPNGCPAVWQSEVVPPGGPSVAVGGMQRSGTSCPAGSPLAPGTNRLPLVIAARSACLLTADPNLGIPACLANGEGPPLAPGTYEVRASANDEAAPFPEPVFLTVGVASTTPAPALGTLSLQSGKRSIQLLVPAGWKFVGQDAGGSGSQSTWTNPSDAHEYIEGTTGVEVGGWWETDGVKGSINPRGFLPAGAHIDRVSNTTFLYEVDAADGYKIDGVWIADLYQGLPVDFVSAQVELPTALHSAATTIINRFISDRKALPPSTTRP